LREIASSYGDPQEVIKFYTGNRQLMERLEMEVMEDQVVDWLLERASIQDHPIAFNELMKPE
jgi:trigger factor